MARPTLIGMRRMDVAERQRELEEQRKQRRPTPPAAYGTEPTHQHTQSDPRTVCVPSTNVTLLHLAPVKARRITGLLTLYRPWPAAIKRAGRLASKP